MLNVYKTDQTARWDEAVQSFAMHDVYWTSGYPKAFAAESGETPLLFHYEDGCGLRGINAVMLRDVAKDPRFAGKLREGEYYDLTTPYGYGGWLIEGGDPEPLFAAYEDWCKQHRIVTEFIRFHPMLRNHEACEKAYQVVELGEVVHIDLSSPEAVWAQMTSKNRNMIRKAEKCGLTVKMGSDQALFERFRVIYEQTMDLKHAKKLYYFTPEFYRSVQEDLAGKAMIFYVEQQDGTIPAASMILRENGWLNYHLSGSLRSPEAPAANNLLLYRVSLWGVEQGCRSFYLGGGVGSGTDSLLLFKKSFQRGPLRHFYIGKKIFDPRACEELSALRTELPETGYFPRYRA